VRFVEIYVREGKVLLPTLAARSGDIITVFEPVTVLDATDREKIVGAIAQAVSEPLPHVDLIDPAAHARTNPLPRAVKVRSWSAFAKPARLWVLKEEDKNLVLVPTHHAYNYGFQDDDQPIRAWPAETDSSVVAKEVVDVIFHSAGESAPQRTQSA
jgi:hypothetical protein